MGTMRMTWVGTGSAFNPTLGHTSFIVEADGSDPPLRVLVDCGSTVTMKLLEWGAADTITDIIVTHPHADHIGGLEALGFYHHFVLHGPEHPRPRLHVATDSLAHTLWEHALRAGMGPVLPGGQRRAEHTLETFFDVRTGRDICLRDLPPIHLFPVRHVEGMENFGLRFANGVFYSGDSVELPPGDPDHIFQDCQLSPMLPGDVHIGYAELCQGLSAAVKKKTHLVHLGVRYGSFNPEADGFAGFVMPGQRFSFDM